MGEHTKLPWRRVPIGGTSMVVSDSPTLGQAICYEPKNGYSIGLPFWDDSTGKREIRFDFVEFSHGDAAFIVEACNNHARLTRENEAMRKALEDCLGCVTAAEAEGLHEVVEELRGFSEQTDRLIDLVERRLIWVRNYAEPALSSLKESPDAKA